MFATDGGLYKLISEKLDKEKVSDVRVSLNDLVI